MEQREYLRVAEDFLNRVASWLEQFDPDEVDYSTGDGIVTLEFADGDRYVLNRQTAAKQLWLAASEDAWHYSWDPEVENWVDDEGNELTERIGQLLSDKLDREIIFE